MDKNINNYPKKPHFIVDVADVTRPANGCGGCMKYAMKSNIAQQGSWRTSDGRAWWLRDARYNDPNGDYHDNCYLHIYDVNPNNVCFNDGNCNYYSTEYMCQPKQTRKCYFCKLCHRNEVLNLCLYAHAQSRVAAAPHRTARRQLSLYPATLLAKL